MNKPSFHSTYIDGFQSLRISRSCPRNSFETRKAFEAKIFKVVYEKDAFLHTALPQNVITVAKVFLVSTIT